MEEHFKDGKTTTSASTVEQRNFVSFLKQHTNIKAYLHGLAHESKLYVYNGPDNDIALNTVGADSPMKGVVSAADETKLTFQFCVIDPKTMMMTVRECFWDSVPATPSTPVKWGNMVTFSLK